MKNILFSISVVIFAVSSCTKFHIWTTLGHLTALPRL